MTIMPLETIFISSKLPELVDGTIPGNDTNIYLNHGTVDQTSCQL